MTISRAFGPRRRPAPHAVLHVLFLVPMSCRMLMAACNLQSAIRCCARFTSRQAHTVARPTSRPSTAQSWFSIARRSASTRRSRSGTCDAPGLIIIYLFIYFSSYLSVCRRHRHRERAAESKRADQRTGPTQRTHSSSFSSSFSLYLLCPLRLSGRVNRTTSFCTYIILGIGIYFSFCGGRLRKLHCSVNPF